MSCGSRDSSPNVISYTACLVSYSAVINAWMKCETREKALQLCDEMQQQGLEPNVITYTPVIWAKGPTWQLSMRCGRRDSCPM